MSQTTQRQSAPGAATGQVVSEASYATVRPRIDMYEAPDAWLLRADMPGVDEHHAEVSLEQQVLTIRGTAALEEPEGFERQYGEFRPRRFERSFRLPEDCDRGQIEATMRNGVLSVRIPKSPVAVPTKITVKSA